MSEKVAGGALEREYRQQGWDLSDLLPEADEATLRRRLEELDERVRSFEETRSELKPDLSAARLVELLKDYEELLSRTLVLISYGTLWFSADTQSEQALTFRNRVEHATTGFRNRVLFFPLWWKGLEDEQAEALLPSAPEHADYRHHLRDLRRLRPHTLDENSERILNLKNANGIDALMTLYSMLTNRLEFRLEVEGEEKVLTRDQISSYGYSPRPELRRAACRELMRVYGRESNLLAQIYVNRVRDWQSENLELRSYPSAIAVRNVGNDLPDEVVSTLIEAARDNAETFRRYFRLKARLLGRERLERYDLYAPLKSTERRIPYAEGVRLVLDTLHDFAPEFGDRAGRVFKEDHIDSEIRRGKRGGAFCATVLPSHTPWILVNYDGKVRDVATLAHELGHAVHSMMADGHSVLTHHAPLPLAETASVFAEILLTERLLERERDPAVRRELLAASLDDVYATVLRQAYFVRFELDAHQAILEGRPPEELCAIYLRNLDEQFGDSVHVPEEFRWEWVSIPHFYHVPFYCYAYSFGQLLVLALFRRYQEEGRAFVPGYLKLLAHGGSARPLEILAEAGVDVTDAGFWRGGFEVVEERVQKLESVAD